MTGIDTPINNLISLFTNKLWTGSNNDYNGRIYDNEKKDEDTDALLGIMPELFTGSEQRYKERLLDSKKDSTVFFRVTDLDPSELLADVSIYFSVNLVTLYPTITTERADAYAIRDAKKWVDWSEFRIEDIITGKPAFADYFGADQNKHDMQPYFLFRIDTEVSYSIDACETTLPTEYNLTLSSDVGGIAISNVGAEGVIPVGAGELVGACAEADTGYEFANWIKNGFTILKNPYAFVMNQDIDLKAYFTFIGGLTQKLKTFITAPVLRGLRYFFGDFSGNDNDVLAKNQRVGTFSGAARISTGLYLQGSSLIDLTLILNVNNFNGSDFLWSSTGSGVGKGLVITRTLAKLFIYHGDGIGFKAINFGSLNRGFNILTINWDGLIGSTITYNLNSNITTELAQYQWVGNSLTPIFVGYSWAALSDNYTNSQIIYSKLTNYYEYIVSHGQGVDIYDISGLDNNGTIQNVVLDTFWSLTSDEAYPYEHILGATLYRNDIDSTILSICVDTSQVITGFTRLGYFPPASGILKGLPNTYHISGVDSTIAEGDYTADQIGAFPESANLELIQTEFAVQSLIVNE